jgi:hypothetical protein
MNEAEKNAWKEVREKLLGEFREFGEIARVLLPTAKHIQSPPPTRESLLEWARSVREVRFKERREQVLMIVERSRDAADPPSVAEIFEAAYGDQAGQEYWRLWLKFGSGAGVESLLVAHFVAENPEVAAAGHPLGRSWGACCAEALARYPSGELVDRLMSIAEDEELGYLIAPSARAFLVSGLPAQNGKRRGPRPVQMTRVINQMRASDQFHRLDDMTEEEMVTHFGASRDTCRKARDTIRSEK